MHEDAPARSKSKHDIGCDLAALSVEELQDRILLLQTEQERIQHEITRKTASKQAADAFFNL